MHQNPLDLKVGDVCICLEDRKYTGAGVTINDLIVIKEKPKVNSSLYSVYDIKRTDNYVWYLYGTQMQKISDLTLVEKLLYGINPDLFI